MTAKSNNNSKMRRVCPLFAALSADIPRMNMINFPRLLYCDTFTLYGSLLLTVTRGDLKASISSKNPADNDDDDVRGKVTGIGLTCVN